jgi:hypothetical protein
MAEMLRAKEGFHVPSLRITVKGGQVVAADDRVVKGREHLFEPADTDIEQATRAPGERRVGTRRDPATVIAGGERPAPKRSPRKKADG